MAKLYIDRLKRKFGAHNLVTGRLSLLMQDIIAFNSNTIAKKVAKINQDGWNKGLRKITKEEKPFIVPSVSDVLPKRSVFILKAAKDGDMISQTLRDSLTKNLRDTLNQFTPKTKESTYIQRRGIGAGRINPKLIDQFQKSITDTFTGYTKKDPKVGMPSNIHAIAVTEMRSTIDDINEQYIDEMRMRNPDMRIRKQWIQNRSLATHPRRGHSAVNGTTIDIDDYFEVPLYRKIMGKEMIIEYTAMSRPHDSGAGPEQVIGCNCEVKYLIKRVNVQGQTVEKAKALPVGTKHQHADGLWYEKQSDGSWTKITKPKESKVEEPKAVKEPKETESDKIYDDEVIRGAKDTGLSNKSFEWLRDWSWKYKSKELPNEDIIKELSKFRPKESVTVYRGIQDKKFNAETGDINSYTYELGMAQTIANVQDSDNYDSEKPSGYVIKRTVYPRDVLVDFTKIPKYDDWFINEIIIFKGNIGLDRENSKIKTSKQESASTKSLNGIYSGLRDFANKRK